MFSMCRDYNMDLNKILLQPKLSETLYFEFYKISEVTGTKLLPVRFFSTSKLNKNRRIKMC